MFIAAINIAKNALNDTRPLRNRSVFLNPDPQKSKNLQFFQKKVQKKFGSFKKVRTFAIPNEKYGSYAEIAQLVEHNLAKVGVASSSLVFRSKKVSRNADLNFETPDVVQLYAGRPLLRSAFFFIYRSPYFLLR